MMTWIRRLFWRRDEGAERHLSDPKAVSGGDRPRRSGSPDRRDPRAGILGAQPLAYLEMAIGFGALVAVNLVFLPADPGFVGVDPHPSWLVVIPIAVRYGAVPGYVVGLLAAVLYLVFAVVRGGSLFDAGILSTQVLLDPVLFILAGAALGELRQAHKRAHARVAERYDEVEDGLQDLAQRYLASMELARELERRVSGQTSTVMTLYRAAKALENVETRDLSPSVLELAASFVDAESCAIYLRRNGGFVFEGGRPQNPGFERPEKLDTTQGLPAAALGQKRTVTVRDLVSDATPAQIARQRPLMVTPLLGEDGEAMGMLVVEKMPFLRFTSASVKLFSMLGDWASGAFQRAFRFQQAKDRNVEDEITGAYNHLYMLKRTEEEMQRARRHGIALSLLAISIADYDEIPPVRVPSVLRTLGLIFARQTRPFDVLGKHVDEGVFLLLIPHADAQQGAAVGDRISREVAAFAFKPFDDERDMRLITNAAPLPESTIDARGFVEEAVDGLRDRVTAQRGDGEA